MRAQVEHLYYKHDDVNVRVRDAVLRGEELTEQEKEAWGRDPSEEIYEMSRGRSGC